MCLPVVRAKANCGPETQQSITQPCKEGSPAAAAGPDGGRHADHYRGLHTCEVQTESTLLGPSAGQGLFKDFQLETMEKSGIGDGGQH